MQKYYTFFRFDELRKEVSLDDIWKKIYQTFLTLKGWYEDHDLYHRIGYLITSGTSLHKIFALSKDKKKSEFNESLDELIKKSVAISGNYSELSYEKPLDYKRISTLLLLFNIESVRRSDGHAQRFPFDQFKHHKGSNVTWSLEHIHAQQSEGMKTQDVWKKWLELHIPSVESIGGEHSELIDEMQGAINADKLERTVFESIQQKVLGLLSVSGNTEYMHSIANLALLNTADNAALNNSTFDVKRNDIIQIRDMGLTDELYIKMNSRGKPLTVFEHFKAELEREIRALDEKKGQNTADRIVGKIDKSWTDLLWKYRSSGSSDADDNIIDDEFLRYFKFVCDIICYRNGQSPQGYSSDIFDLLHLERVAGQFAGSCHPDAPVRSGSGDVVHQQQKASDMLWMAFL